MSLGSHIIVIRRGSFELDLFRRLPFGRKWTRIRRYPIAIGMEGMKTPPGMYEVQERSRHPAYQYPDSQWVRDMGIRPGTLIQPDDPNNPVAPRWLGISEDQGIGIHGTHRLESLGTRASHGCIRLAPLDVIELYDFAKRGTPCFVY